MSPLKSSSQQSHFIAGDTEVQGGQPGHTLRCVFPKPLSSAPGRVAAGLGAWCALSQGEALPSGSVCLRLAPTPRIRGGKGKKHSPSSLQHEKKNEIG